MARRRRRRRRSSTLAAASGWYIVLGAGEKVDGESTTLSMTTYFGTNTPASNASFVCVGNLGIAKTYAVNYMNAAATIGVNGTAGLDG